jgi:hypothetical protein
MPGLSASGFSSLGGAVSDIFGAVGQAKSAKGYGQAAGYARQNAQIAQESTDIQELQAQRKIYKVEGGQRADIAGAGLASAGSALDLMRDTAAQGSLTKQVIANQGAINVLGYQAEAASYDSMASAAKTASAGGFLGGLLKIASVAAPFIAASDDRLKHGAVEVDRRRDGLGIFEFSYKGSGQRFRGVMASEVERIYPDAVMWVDGVRHVNYSMIGVLPEVVEGV